MKKRVYITKEDANLKLSVIYHSAMCIIKRNEIRMPGKITLY